MKKRFLTALALIAFIIPFISATNLEINLVADDVAMIRGLNMPAVFDLEIRNLGESDNFMFYDFFGSSTFPKGTVQILGGETKNVEVGIYPGEDLKQDGWVQFSLFIKGDTGEVEHPLMVDIMALGEAFEIGAEDFKPDSNEVSVYIKNTANFNFEDIKANFKSPFFELEKTFSLKPYQKETFEVSLNKEDFRELMAGIYTLSAEISAGEQTANVEGTMRFSEKDIVTSLQDDYGIIVHTKRILKVNEGNTISLASTVIKKNIISRLFTTFSPEPQIVERKGVEVYYTWEKNMKPGERMEIVVKTNWLLPLLAILLVISIVILTKQFSKTSLSLRKRVSFVKAKGGEFALKVSVIVNAKRYIEKVNIIDRLPPLVKLHERFGGEMPRKIDEKGRRLEWTFDKLQAGESRVISYIIYSRVGVLGKFALPTTTAVYERDGEVREAESNHAFFIADQIKKELED